MSNVGLLLEEGITAMVLGMGVVFAFLTVMIFAMGIMSKIVLWLNKIFPEKIVETGKKAKKATKKADDTEVAIAVAVAMSKK